MNLQIKWTVIFLIIINYSLNTTKPFLKINHLERINCNSIITEVEEKKYIYFKI
jgi:hypothetical protein